MIRVVLVTLLGLLWAGTAVSQEEPIPPKRSSMAKIGGLFGYTPGWLFVDVKPINQQLIGAGGAALKENGVYLNGIGGGAYIMFVPNLRVGGLGMSGRLTSTALNSAGVRRDAELSVSFGGVTVDYVVPIVERLDVSVGVTLGAGSIELMLRQTNGGALTWGGEWNNYGNGNYHQGGQVGNISRKLTGSFFSAVPAVNVEYAILGWLGVRLGASYVTMFSPTWQVDEKYDLLGVPSNIKGNGFMINAGLFVGTF